MGRLIGSGEIAGFTVLTRAEVSSAPVRGQMMIQADPRGTDRVMARLLGLAEVTAVHSTNGTWDLIAEIGTDTLEALDDVLTLIRRFEGVTRSETNLLLSTRRPVRRPG
jgi:DNA-binding Lrp family transcriptional regulator